VLRLPDDVRDFVCEAVVFLSSPFGHGFRGGDWSHKWLILLPPDLPDADATSVVAHQIAHAWRGTGVRWDTGTPPHRRRRPASSRGPGASRVG
jgi:hypothetical protein